MKDKDGEYKGYDAKPGLIQIGKLRLSQDYIEMSPVKKIITSIPVRKPNKHDYVRVHPDAAYQFATVVLELKEERETYLVEPALWEELRLEVTSKVLYTTINRQGVLALWAIGLPREDGRSNEWNNTAHDAAIRAKQRWLRLIANMSLGAYEVYEAKGNIPEPEWPDLTFEEIINIAFKDRLINSLEHPVVRRLRGEI